MRVLTPSNHFNPLLANDTLPLYFTMYADITKPPKPLPTTRPVSVVEGITVLPPLTRRGHGPGLIILQDDSENHLEIIQGVPSALIKWSEEGYVVAEIQAKAFQRGANEVLADALASIKKCPEFESGAKIGLVGTCSLIYL